MIVFFGTSHHSAKFLELATKNGLKFDLVISEPPKPLGRKQILTENPTISIAEKLNIPFLIHLEEILNFPSPTLGLILDFNKIIPQNTIDHFQKGIINIHFSKLPQYRGPAPVQYTILNGNKRAWITYYLITQKVDGGPILKQSSLPLEFTETADSLYEKLIEKSAKEIPTIISAYLSDKDYPCQQTGIPSYTKKLTTDNCKIDWSKSPEEIERLIRAAYSEPGAWTEVKLQITNYKLQTKRLKILKAHLEKGNLVLDEVQLEGKNPVSWAQFQEGYPEAKII